ncbi:unnamed protein product [Paramecium sonneborni]|uniref:Dipeptidyl peptidase 1 n=1 Tax=Paramecium sonneborni TaxID=65129 RepID=A0A8S1R2M7_9CILI|nr:unnamed protein product [Paramecium sonneborni]
MRFVILLCMIGFVVCDLPVHCLKHQVSGKWRLYLEKPTQKGVGLLPCGHEVPDRAKTSYMAYSSNFQPSQDFEVTLGDDYKVKSSSKSGEWTMVYDEGFEIKLGNMKYFAFSKYEPKGREGVSYCDQTLVGWYTNLDTQEKGCYRAEKTEKVESSESIKTVSIVQPEFMDDDDMKSLSFLQVQEKTPELNHDDLVEKLNQKEGTWKAKVYDHMKGKSFAEVAKSLGKKKGFRKDKSYKQQESTSNKVFIQTGEYSELPSSFNWKEKLSPPRQQGQCGSCYAIATMSMLSARLKIQGENVDLSPQWSLNCNYFNQGCDGGYPYLVNKFAEEQVLVSEAAEPYQGFDGSCNFQKAKSQSKVYKTKNYKYLGGSYGRVSEQVIMMEIMKNGPVVLSFEPSYDFMYYESGIYHSKAETNDYAEWEKVDHSVLCFGWGEESGVKFWMLQNSWGDQWGEGGNFRMKRGVDESAIESMAEASDPYVVNQNSSTSFSETKANNSDFDYEDDDSIFSFNQIRQNLK